MNFAFEVRPKPFCPGIRILQFSLMQNKTTRLGLVVCFLYLKSYNSIHIYTELSTYEKNRLGSPGQVPAKLPVKHPLKFCRKSKNMRFGLVALATITASIALCAMLAAKFLNFMR